MTHISSTELRRRADVQDHIHAGGRYVREFRNDGMKVVTYGQADVSFDWNEYDYRPYVEPHHRPPPAAQRRRTAMGEVKRYYLSNKYDDMREASDGDYVFYSDYATLETEIARLGGCLEVVTSGNVELAAEVALRRSEVELFRDELKARCDENAKLRAEVAKLSAAAAQMREALEAFDADQVPHDMALEMREAALSTDAGKGWIDASGAVEARLHCEYGDPSVGVGDHWFLTDNDMDYTWAGSKVKIVRVAK